MPAALVARAIDRGAGSGRAYNVIDGVGDVGRYLDAVYGRIGRPAPPLPPDAARLRHRYPADRARDELGFSPDDRWSSFLAELVVYTPPPPWPT